eukprot:1640519-Alexandrium_andersonii.AAC.2
MAGARASSPTRPFARLSASLSFSTASNWGSGGGQPAWPRGVRPPWPKPLTAAPTRRTAGPLPF